MTWRDAKPSRQPRPVQTTMMPSCRETFLQLRSSGRDARRFRSCLHCPFPWSLQPSLFWLQQPSRTSFIHLSNGNSALVVSNQTGLEDRFRNRTQHGYGKRRQEGRTHSEGQTRCYVAAFKCVFEYRHWTCSLLVPPFFLQVSTNLPRLANLPRLEPQDFNSTAACGCQDWSADFGCSTAALRASSTSARASAMTSPVRSLSSAKATRA